MEDGLGMSDKECGADDEFSLSSFFFSIAYFIVVFSAGIALFVSEFRFGL